MDGSNKPINSYWFIATVHLIDETKELGGVKRFLMEKHNKTV
jgi:hypothetical protein